MIPLRDIRRQIQSIQKISHITRAMKAVSAIRLMRLQSQVTQQRPYALKLHEVVADLVARTPGKAHPMLRPRAPETGTAEGDERSADRRERIACLALGSDRGLCGAFNANLVLEINRFLKERPGRDVQLIVVGKRLRDLLRSRQRKIARELSGFSRDLSLEKVVKLAGEFKAAYLDRQLDQFWVIYTEFKSPSRQKVVADRLLPIGTELLPKEPLFPEYRYEPGEFTVLDQILPMYFDREAWRVFVGSQASEHITRMRAMDMATVNAGEMIRDLTLALNKARQELITRELSEISSAAEALRG